MTVVCELSPVLFTFSLRFLLLVTSFFSKNYVAVDGEWPSVFADQFVCCGTCVFDDTFYMGHGTYTPITCMFDAGRHGSVVIASNVHSPGAAVLLWARPKQTVPYQPTENQRINFPAVFCALLLLTSGDIELNPGPNTSSLSIGCLSICSAANKVGCIHNTIADFNLDVLALCETNP